MDPAIHNQLLEIERRLEQTGWRGHVYLPSAGPATMTTAERSRGTSEIIGPTPIRDAMRASVGSNESFQDWTARLRTGASGLVPPVLWNSVHLVVTGVTATHALLIAVHHVNEYDDHELDELRAATRADACDLEQAFTAATGTTPLPPALTRLRPPRSRLQASQAPRAPAAVPHSHPEGETILTTLAEETRADPLADPLDLDTRGGEHGCWIPTDGHDRLPDDSRAS